MTRGLALALVLAVLFVAFRDATAPHVTHLAVLKDTDARWNSPPRESPIPAAALRPVMRLTLVTVAPDAPLPWAKLKPDAVVDILQQASTPQTEGVCRLVSLLRIPMDCAALIARTSLDRSRSEDTVTAAVYLKAAATPAIVHAMQWSVPDNRASTRVLTVLLFVVRLAMLALAVVVIVLARSVVAWDFFLICVALAFGITSNPTWATLTVSAFFLRVLIPIALLFAISRTIILLTRFPLPGIVTLQRRMAQTAPWLFVAGAVFFAYFDIIDLWYHSPLTGIVFQAGVAVFALANVTMLITLYRAIARAIDAAPDRKRLSWVGVSLTIGLVALAASWISRIFIDHLRPDPSWLSVALLMPIVAAPLGLAYAVLGLNAVNLDRLIRRATAASLLSTAILIAIELGLTLFKDVGAGSGPHTDTEGVQQGAVLFSVVAGVVLHRFAEPIAALPDRFLFRDWRTAKQGLTDLTGMLEYVSEAAAFATLSVTRVSALVETGAGMYRLSTAGWHREAATWPEAPELVAGDDPGVLAATASQAAFVAVGADSAFANAYIFPLRSESRTIGLLVCRGGDARQPYTSEETDAIAEFVRNAAAPLASLERRQLLAILRNHFLAEPTSPEREWLLQHGYLDAAPPPGP